MYLKVLTFIRQMIKFSWFGQEEDVALGVSLRYPCSKEKISQAVGQRLAMKNPIAPG